MTDMQEKEHAKIEPIFTTDKKKRVKARAVTFNGEFDGKPWASKGIQLEVAKMDRDGDPSKKTKVLIPVDCIDHVIGALQNLKKKL